jgi:hypothetical protein
MAKPKQTKVPAAKPATAPVVREPSPLPKIPAPPAAVADAKAALDAGAKALREIARAVLANLAKHIEAGPSDPNYEWSMKLVSERLLPARAIAAAGIKHLGGDASGNSMHNIQINVVAANPRGSACVDSGQGHRAPHTRRSRRRRRMIDGLSNAELEASLREAEKDPELAAALRAAQVRAIRTMAKCAGDPKSKWHRAAVEFMTPDRARFLAGWLAKNGFSALK